MSASRPDDDNDRGKLVASEQAASDEEGQRTAVSSPDALTARFYVRNAVLMALSFSLVECALLVVLGLQTAVNKTLGEVTSGSLYVTFALGAIPAPFIVSRMGSKRALTMGLALYSAYVAANMAPGWGTLLPSALISGFGGNCLWTAEGSYMARCATQYALASGRDARSALGAFNGGFFFSFQAAIVSGQIVSSLLLRAGLSLTALFAGCTVLAVVATVLSCALATLPNDAGTAAPAPKPAVRRNGAAISSSAGGPEYSSLARNVSNVSEAGDRPEPVDLSQPSSSAAAAAGDPSTALRGDRSPGGGPYDEQLVEPAAPAPPKTMRSQMMRAIRIVRTPKMRYMIASNMGFGFSQGFQNGYFARRLVGDGIGVSNIGILGGVSSGVGALVAFPFGYLSDRYGRKPLMLLGFASHVAVALFYASVDPAAWQAEGSDSNTLEWAVLAISSVLLGLGNAVWNGTNMTVFGEFFTADREAAFANLKMWSGMATAIGYFAFPYISLRVQTAMIAATLVAGIVGYFAAHRAYRSEQLLGDLAHLGRAQQQAADEEAERKRAGPGAAAAAAASDEPPVR